MVVDKCHGVAIVVRVAGDTFIAQRAPVAIAEGIVNHIFQRKIKCCAIVARAANPALHRAIAAVPIFTHAKFRLRALVVELGVLRVVALHHIVAKTGIAEVVEQEIEVKFHIFLHIG